MCCTSRNTMLHGGLLGIRFKNFIAIPGIGNLSNLSQSLTDTVLHEPQDEEAL